MFCGMHFGDKTGELISKLLEIVKYLDIHTENDVDETVWSIAREAESIPDLANIYLGVCMDFVSLDIEAKTERLLNDLDLSDKYSVGDFLGFQQEVNREASYLNVRIYYDRSFDLTILDEVKECLSFIEQILQEIADESKDEEKTV